MEKRNIKTDAALCVGCMACQLICSLIYTGAFNPERACIVIDPPNELRFTEECRKGCTLCTRYCDLGAIISRVSKA
jgi:MinD superfamily P-loop ATPase